MVLSFPSKLTTLFSRRTLSIKYFMSKKYKTASVAGVIGAGIATSCYLAPVLSSESVKVEKSTDASSPYLVLPKLDFNTGPRYSSDTTTVVFVLGGPGVGKGTQCALLEKELGFIHISAGDLLREERERVGSPYGELIDYYIREGKIVPYEITISLLQRRMESHPNNHRFLIDGFPRNIDQGIAFETTVCASRTVLFFECGEEEMLKRLMNRSQNSGRTDDNIESIKKRFRVFQESTVPVREFYRDLEKLKAVQCTGSVEQVFEQVKKAVIEAGLAPK